MKLVSGFAFFVLAAAGLLLGCATAPEPQAGPSPGDVVQLSVMTMPVGLNLDQYPGVDGFSAKVYANDAENPKTIPITRGQLEILIWDGTLFGRTSVPPPLRIWKWDAPQLRPHQFVAGIGAGYEFSLLWGTNQPTKRIITVAARYTAPNGRIVTSSPSSVTVIDP